MPLLRKPLCEICIAAVNELVSKSHVPLPWKLRARLARDALDGIVCLHSQDIVHRDIKTENILVRAVIPTGHCSDRNASTLWAYAMLACALPLLGTSDPWRTFRTATCAPHLHQFHISNVCMCVCVRCVQVDDTWRCVVADYGFARKARKDLAMTICGTDEFMAPEVIFGEMYDERAVS